MPETKPMTTADQGDTKKPVSDVPAPNPTKGDQRQDQASDSEKLAASSNKPASVRAEPRPNPARAVSERDSKHADEPAKVETPSPTQAELDAMREGKFGNRRRVVTAGGQAAEYKTR